MSWIFVNQLLARESCDGSEEAFLVSHLKGSLPCRYRDVYFTTGHLGVARPPPALGPKLAQVGSYNQARASLVSSLAICSEASCPFLPVCFSLFPMLHLWVLQVPRVFSSFPSLPALSLLCPAHRWALSPWSWLFPGLYWDLHHLDSCAMSVFFRDSW